MYKCRKEFNVAGPCVPGEHYMLDPLRGIGDDLMDLIHQKHYFVIHAARQSGKTTLLKQLARDINAEGEYHALYCNLEAVQEWTEPDSGIPAIVRTLLSAIKGSGMPDGFARDVDYDDPANVLRDSLSAYCKMLDKPLAIFFDETDCLSNGTLITFLRQLRGGYINRGDIPFVRAAALVGMRNLRDYKAKARGDSPTLGSASPFNIVTEVFCLRNFTAAEVAELYAQHTAETGQTFEQQAIDYAFEQTQGQPWLVNAVARECVEKIAKKDYSLPVTRNMAEQAIHNIILARGTHVDSLLERLKEPRVRKIIQPLIMGEEVADKSDDDYMFTKDLGLIKDDRVYTEPANPIYAELIFRTLTRKVQESMINAGAKYAPLNYVKDGKIDINVLMKAFQEYWRENSEIWRVRYEKEIYEYDEAAAHLVMQAFLQRVVNGGGDVRREAVAGTRRVDLCVEYGGHKYPIELKILQNESSRAESLEQIRDYMDKFGSDAGWLVLFDKTAGKSWDEKIYMREETADGKRVTVVGC
ncbi:hypothetical protein R80B4_01894 [Fibrobacteres bacterium R8-0-B4]